MGACPYCDSCIGNHGVVKCRSRDLQLSLRLLRLPLPTSLCARSTSIWRKIGLPCSIKRFEGLLEVMTFKLKSYFMSLRLEGSNPFLWRIWKAGALLYLDNSIGEDFNNG